MNDFDEILKDVTRHLVDSCYNYDDADGMNIKQAIGNVRIEQEYWAGILQAFKEEGLI